VLDVGCGSKPYRLEFSQAEKYIGIDVPTSGHNHSTSQMDLFFDGRRLPFPKLSFDCIVSFEVIEHVSFLDDWLREIDRVLKRGGYMIISCPFVWREHEMPFDFRRFSEKGLVDLGRSLGYECVKSIRTTSSAEATFQLLVVETAQALKETFGRFVWILLVPIYSISYLIFVISRVFLKSRQGFYLGTVAVFRKPPDGQMGAQ
jgi:SAM-dependent methyltransferase